MSEASAVNGTSNTKCIRTIDLAKFQLGCLGPALAIIVVLSCLKRRSKLKLEYCHGYPGLLIPVNFLHSFSYSNRFTIAATFGATASYCVGLFLFSSFGTFASSSVSVWLKVFEKIFYVLIYGILFYPFFACLTTEYKLVGASLGFLYAAIRFCFTVAIYFQCESDNKGDIRHWLFIQFLSVLPTVLCLLFITLRFAVLLILEVRRKWFLTINGHQESAVETNWTRLAAEHVVRHVKQILTPGLNRNAADAKWYIKLLHYIYKPREDFKFSTQLVSTVVVAAITVFQLFVNALYVADVLKKRVADWSVGKDLLFDLFDIWQGAFVLSAMISAIFLLHFMKTHRDHVLQLYRGQRKFAQGVFPSPAKLVLGSLRFSGFQVAYTIYGYLSLGIVLWLVLAVPVLFFKYFKPVLSKNHWEWCVDKAESVMSAFIMSAVLYLFQLFLVHYVFRDRDFPRIVITVDNRRLFSIMSYFLFFFNILVGLFSGFLRITFGIVLGIVFLARVDRSTLMQGFQRLDRAFVAYLGFINLLVAQSHPVMLLFCQLLINRDEGHQPNSGSPAGAQSENSHCSKETGVASVYTSERRLPRMSQKAFNRWHLTVTLLRNPSLIKYRRRDGITRATSFSLSSICTDWSDLVLA